MTHDTGMLRSVKDITALSGKRVVVRVDFNVPIVGGKIRDDFRITKALPTITYLTKKGAIVVLIAHLGEDGTQSLLPIAEKLKKFVPVTFLKTSVFSNETEIALENQKKGTVVLLENIRREKGEKENSPSFGRALSRLGEYYVNDAFSVSHRMHASIIGIPKHIPGYAGFQFMEEVANLSSAFSPKHPFLFILGGAKFETKIPLVKKFLKEADTVYIAGALANNFFKARGYEVGLSLVDEGNLGIPNLLKHKNLVLPSDVEVSSGKTHRACRINQVTAGDTIVDVGPESIKELENLIAQAKYILWNGPLGKYESGFGGATEKILKALSKTKAKSIVGGGDTVALISKLKLESKLGFVSTGGGATLEYLAKGTLPGIKALMK